MLSKVARFGLKKQNVRFKKSFTIIGFLKSQSELKVQKVLHKVQKEQHLIRFKKHIRLKSTV